MRTKRDDTTRRGFAFGRRPPPDYTQRSVKLRLFVYVAAVMLLLSVIERARDPAAWRWFTNLDRAARQEPFNNRLADRGLRTAVDPAGTFVAADPKPSATAAAAPTLDPVQQAWQQAWNDVLARLSSDQQSLLFEMLHAAMTHRPLVAEKTGTASELIQSAHLLWDDYQAAAFQSVANLKGDDQAHWIDVLRQVNGRFAEALPALQSIVDGRTPTEAEEIALRGLQTTAASIAQQATQDDTVAFRPAEREIWFHSLARVHDADPRELSKASLGRVTYLQLYKQPADYRGQVVTVAGSVRLAYRVPAPTNYLGVKEYCVYWLYPAGGPDSPIVVYALDTPPGFPPIGDGKQQAGKLREDVLVTGIFFKRCAYAGRGGVFTAPLLIASLPVWRPQDAAAPIRAPFTPLELAAAAIAVLLLVICLTAVLWKRSSQTHRTKSPTSGGFADLGSIELGPSTQEKLRDLEQQARDEVKT